ncbi:hypothetical protein B0H14DRAFT_2601537 [Mycena olivaceomarginata]|nr:hypothetical protein B0H14DRAFT_2601537 [Mycena olivaceomarginata]
MSKIFHSLQGADPPVTPKFHAGQIVSLHGVMRRSSSNKTPTPMNIRSGDEVYDSPLELNFHDSNCEGRAFVIPLDSSLSSRPPRAQRAIRYPIFAFPHALTLHPQSKPLSSANILEHNIPAPTVDVSRYRERRGRFDDGHMRRFWALAKEPGFTGSLVPGKALEVSAAQREACEAERVARAAATRDEREREEMEVDSSDEEGGRVVSSDEEEKDDEEDERVFFTTPRRAGAEVWMRRCERDEEMREGWSDEEGDEELESALSAKLYMLSMLAVDGVRGAGGGQ